MVGVSETKPSSVTDEIPIDSGMVTRLDSYDLTIASTAGDIASQGAMEAERGGSFKIPPPSLVASRLIREYTRRAYINQVA
jgi:hypothetical protein